MGFLDNLKDIGFGNTGPYGRMRSGATNYANYAKDRQSVESGRGVAQALALAAKSGKMIPYDKFVGIAEMWKVPVEQVAIPGRKINEGLHRQMIKTQTHEAMQFYANKKKEDPSWEPTEPIIKDYAIQNQLLPETMGVLKDYIVKAKKYITRKSGDDLISVGGNDIPKVEIPGVPKEKDKWEQMPDNGIGI